MNAIIPKMEVYTKSTKRVLKDVKEFGDIARLETSRAGKKARAIKRKKTKKAKAFRAPAIFIDSVNVRISRMADGQ